MEGREVHAQESASVKAVSEGTLDVWKDVTRKQGSSGCLEVVRESETGVRARSCAAL